MCRGEETPAMSRNASKLGQDITLLLCLERACSHEQLELDYVGTSFLFVVAVGVMIDQYLPILKLIFELIVMEPRGSC